MWRLTWHQYPASDSNFSGSNFTLAQWLPLKILIAEDNLVNQKLMLAQLQELGYQADVASNGLEVLEALQRRLYDVVLMDIRMPRMDGIEATRWLRQQWEETRIIAVTAKTMASDRDECLNAGMDDYLCKPIHLEELARALTKCQPLEEPVYSRISAAPCIRQEATPPIDVSPISPVLANQPLEALYEMVGSEHVAEIIHCYMVEATKYIQTIETAIDQEDPIALELAANTLRSSSTFLGAYGFSGLCQQLEAIGRRGETQAAVEKLPQLEAEFKQVKTALRVHLKFAQAIAPSLCSKS
ncbi:response regulator [Kovacikia minuta CCNUW1]|uniref:response regulator n=1 Tax=Kovacikia minuta TaxID=2931930 RepID=UPI001CC8EE6E|nr:response regulator [Kovacikia minuta]UBF25712.1 response regulator [Kovacikia minuta CCNUW1]